MNAHGYFEELQEEETPARDDVIDAVATDPEPTATQYPESDRARAWFNGVQILGFPASDEHAGKTARFYTHDVSVYRNKNGTYGLHTTSPQARNSGFFSLGTGRGSNLETIEDLRPAFDQFLAEREEKQAKANARRDAKRAARADFVNPYSVGDFLYTSWGYDQTNVEFFQVLEVRPTSLKIRKVFQKGVESWRDGGSCVPVANDWRTDSEEITVSVQVRADGSHRISYEDHGLITWGGAPVSWSTGR